MENDTHNIETCNGDGTCLKQSSIKNPQYSRIKHDHVICNHNCVAILCHNYIVCKSNGPQKLFNRIGKDTCFTCNLTFNKLTIIQENRQCPVCLKTKQGVIQKCGHFICADCLHKIYFVQDDEPEFPESMLEFEEEYFNNVNDKKWSKYPEIMKYEYNYEVWESAMSSKQVIRCPECGANNTPIWKSKTII